MGCGGSDSGANRTLTIVVNAPFSKTPYVGETIARGVELGAAVTGPIGTKDGTVELRVRRLDNALSPRRAIANVRRAVADGAVAIVDEGTGVDGSWRIANDARIPVCITYQGGTGLVDVERRPNVFRIAPTDRGIAFRLAEYLIPKGLRIAILTDDTAYGGEGRAALATSFGANPEAVALRLRLPADAPDLAPQVLRAKRAGATALLVWARPTTIANVLTAARGRRWAAPQRVRPSTAPRVRSFVVLMAGSVDYVRKYWRTSRSQSSPARARAMPWMGAPPSCRTFASSGLIRSAICSPASSR